MLKASPAGVDGNPEMEEEGIPSGASTEETVMIMLQGLRPFLPSPSVPKESRRRPKELETTKVHFLNSHV